MYEFQIKVRNNETGEMEWKSVRPTGEKPYQYETEEEAWEKIDWCYPLTSKEEKRVVKV